MFPVYNYIFSHNFESCYTHLYIKTGIKYM